MKYLIKGMTVRFRNQEWVITNMVPGIDLVWVERNGNYNVIFASDLKATVCFRNYLLTVENGLKS
jgi:hypothetical protein